MLKLLPLSGQDVLDIKALAKKADLKVPSGMNYSQTQENIDRDFSARIEVSPYN